MSATVSQYGGVGRPVGYRVGDSIQGPNGGTPIATIEGNNIWMGQSPQGAPQFHCDGKYVRAGGSGGPIVFNIRDNGQHMSIGDGTGQSHHLSSTTRDPMALAATAVAWIGDMRLRNPGADVVDGRDYAARISGPAYRDNCEFRLTRANGNVPWEDRSVPEDLLARFGADNFSPDMNRRLMESRVPASANNRYEKCGQSYYSQKEEALKEATEIAEEQGLDVFEFDGKKYYRDPEEEKEDPNLFPSDFPGDGGHPREDWIGSPEFYAKHYPQILWKVPPRWSGNKVISGVRDFSTKEEPVSVTKTFIDVVKMCIFALILSPIVACILYIINH